MNAVGVVLWPTLATAWVIDDVRRSVLVGDTDGDGALDAAEFSRQAERDVLLQGASFEAWVRRRLPGATLALV